MPNWDDPKNQARPELPNIFKVEGEAAPSPQAATPPICKCGHERNAHEIEPPYYCNGWSMEHGGCECDGYTIPVPVSSKIDTTGFTDTQCRQVLAAIQLSRELGFRDGRSSVGQAEAPRPSAPNICDDCDADPCRVKLGTGKCRCTCHSSKRVAESRPSAHVQIDRIFDALAEETMNISDEEILAEMTPEDYAAVERLKKRMLKTVADFKAKAESRPSAGEFEKMAKEWMEHEGFTPTNRLIPQHKRSGTVCLDGMSMAMDKILAAFYQWMEERITRP
jgi:hypothetical protein